MLTASLTSPVASCLKLSAVLGTLPPKRPISIRPTASPPMVTSKNTCKSHSDRLDRPDSEVVVTLSGHSSSHCFYLSPSPTSSGLQCLHIVLNVAVLSLCAATMQDARHTIQASTSYNQCPFPVGLSVVVKTQVANK